MLNESGSRRLRQRYQKGDIFWGYTMILPLMIGLTVFFFIPFFRNIYNSFFTIGAFNRSTFSGLDNYKKLLTDSGMWNAYGNTFKYVIVVVPICTLSALVLAFMLNLNIRGKSTFRTVYFLPTITMATAVAMVWRWIFNGNYGLLNQVLKAIGLNGNNWLTDPQTAFPIICLVIVWQGIGYNMVILLAGLQGISRSFYEAAEIDGASTWQQFRHITMPLISPTLFFVIVNQFIGTFQIFDLVQIMIPQDSIILEDVQSIVMYFYRNAFLLTKRGLASAIAVFIFVTILIITIIQFVLQKRWVVYD